MACACKTKQKQILGSKAVEEKVPRTLWEKVKHYTLRTVHTIIVAVLFVILTPIVIIGVIYNYAAKGRLGMPLPTFFIKKAKEANKKLKEQNG